MTRRGRIAAALTSAGALLAVLGFPAAADAEADRTRTCEKELDRAAIEDMETFGNFEADEWRALHHPDAISVFPSGHVFVGIDEIMNALSGHFQNRNATWEYEELHRVVDGCRSAYILYETTYAIPEAGFYSHAMTGVTWTRYQGKWLVTGDQGTQLP